MIRFKEFLDERVAFGDDYYRTAFEFFLKKYGVNPASITVVIKERENLGANHDDGLTVPAAKDKFVVFIKPNHPQADMLRLLAHEAAHVAQIVNGELGINPKTKEISWKGEVVDINKVPYRRRPWELDAYTKEKKYIHDFIKKHGNKLNEKISPVAPNREWEKEKKVVMRIIADAKKIKNKTILARAMNLPNSFPFYFVTNKDRKAFMGKILDHGELTDVYNRIGLKGIPIFTRPGKSSTFFGASEGIVVPKGKFRAFQSPLVSDSAVISSLNPKTKLDKTPEEIANSYKQGDWKGTNEVIIDADEYWFINVGPLIDRNYSKFKKITDPKQLKTYDDVITMMWDYIKWNNWKAKQDEQQR